MKLKYIIFLCGFVTCGNVMAMEWLLPKWLLNKREQVVTIDKTQSETAKNLAGANLIDAQANAINQQAHAESQLLPGNLESLEEKNRALRLENQDRENKIELEDLKDDYLAFKRLYVNLPLIKHYKQLSANNFKLGAEEFKKNVENQTNLFVEDKSNKTTKNSRISNLTSNQQALLKSGRPLQDNLVDKISDEFWWNSFEHGVCTAGCLFATGSCMTYAINKFNHRDPLKVASLFVGSGCLFGAYLSNKERVENNQKYDVTEKIIKPTYQILYGALD